MSKTDPIQAVVSNGALRLALQRTETGRLSLFLGLCAASVVLASLRHVFHGKAMQGQTFVLMLALVGLAAVYGVALLVLVRRSTARQVLLPTWVWAITVVIEACIPTIGILLLQNSGRVSATDALDSPAVLMYGALITLTILRMRPWLCLLAGATAGVGHALLFARAALHAQPPLGAGEYPYYLSYAVNLFITGAAAAMVAGAVRGYFLASLREAEAKRQLDRVHHELDLARSIQMGLLPAEPPVAPGFDIAGWSRPADQTGGDYYDWQTLPDGRIILSIADATGHGIGPALVSAVCRAYARAAVQGNDDSTSLLNRLNGLLSADLPSGKFVTFAGVVLNPLTYEAEILSAGHGPLLLRRSGTDGRWDESLESHGPPFAVVSDIAFDPPTRFRFEPGDLLVLLTDGAFEWDNGTGEQFGIPRLREVIGSHATLPAGQIIQEIDRALRRFAGSSVQQDDVTIVVIKCEPMPAAVVAGPLANAGAGV